MYINLFMFIYLGTDNKITKGEWRKGQDHNFFIPSQGRVIKKLNNQTVRSHKFKPKLYASFTLLKAPKQITVIIL